MFILCKPSQPPSMTKLKKKKITTPKKASISNKTWIQILISYYCSFLAEYMASCSSYLTLSSNKQWSSCPLILTQLYAEYIM